MRKDFISIVPQSKDLVSILEVWAMERFHSTLSSRVVLKPGGIGSMEPLTAPRNAIMCGSFCFGFFICS